MRYGLMAGIVVLAACLSLGCREHLPVERTSAATRGPDIVVSLVEEAPVVEVQPDFSNVAARVGIDFTFFNDEVKGRYFLPEVMGGGAAWLDYDLDGWLDLYLVNGAPLAPLGSTGVPHANCLFRSNGERFADVSGKAGTQHGGGFGQGCAVGDFDADGFPDVIPNAHVVSAEGLNGTDMYHFDLVGQRELGKRYGEKMQEVLTLP
jgi:hypothetical protein